MRRAWELARIGDLLTIQNGFAFDSKQFSESKGVPLIRIRDLKGGQKTETNYTGPFDKRYRVKASDLLIGMDGEFGCFEWRGGDALLNQRVCRLEGFSEQLEPKFLFYGINKYLKEIEDATTYTTVKQAAHPTDARHRHWQDGHRLPDRLGAVPEPVEPIARTDAATAHPVPRRPQHPGRSGLQRLLGLSRRRATPN